MANLVMRIDNMGAVVGDVSYANGTFAYSGAHPEQARALIESMLQQPRYEDMTPLEFFTSLPQSLRGRLGAQPVEASTEDKNDGGDGGDGGA